MESKARFFFVPHLVGWWECKGQPGMFASSCWNVFTEWESKQNIVFDKGFSNYIWVFPYMVVPPKHPKCWSFLVGNPWLLGTTILGNIHLLVGWNTAKMAMFQWFCLKICACCVGLASNFMTPFWRKQNRERFLLAKFFGPTDRATGT